MQNIKALALLLIVSTACFFSKRMLWNPLCCFRCWKQFRCFFCIPFSRLAYHQRDESNAPEDTAIRDLHFEFYVIFCLSYARSSGRNAGSRARDCG
jgi:hypothetical protein